MAQLRTEVRPSVQSMPTEGFSIQTGGSARRKIVPNEGNDHYKVSGVPGHTHNASAVLSVLCDQKRTRGVDFTLSDDWAYVPVVHNAADPGDNDPLDEDLYDRALERGIGEIAIIPENCHQEIREPVRDIYELRTLVTPKDKLDTSVFFRYILYILRYISDRD